MYKLYVFSSEDDKADALKSAGDLRRRLKDKAMGIPDDMSHLTQPEPINHNELKRLLIECFDEVFDSFPGVVPYISKERVARRISRAILNGDDS